MEASWGRMEGDERVEIRPLIHDNIYGFMPLTYSLTKRAGDGD